MPVVWNVAWGLTWIGAALLLLAGAAKVVRPVASADALAMSGFPSSQRTARGLGAGEVLLGAVVLATGSALAVGGLALAYLAFALVAGRLLRAGASSCGCFGEVDAPLSRIHVVVNAVLAVAGAAAATGAPPAVGGPLELTLVAGCVVLGAWMVRAVLVQVPALADGIRRLEAA